MQWIHNYQLFLFDFDGLLVNTEEIHYMAYQRMCAGRGLTLDWDFPRYCQAAHYEADALRQHIYEHFPQLYAEEPNWNVLYTEKKKALQDLLMEGAAHLMPGVIPLLQALHAANIRHCVVTHSPDPIVNIIRQQHPILDRIPFWITREDYSNPKPHPECYQKAIRMYATPQDRVIGFEDTPRGIRALLGAHPLVPVLICQAQYPEIPAFIQQGVVHFPSFDKIPESGPAK